MENNSRIGSKSAPYMRVNNNGLFLNLGATIGIVKNNLDTTRSGRLQVYIPDYGGANENEPSNWLTVSYVSPFRGQTRQRVGTGLYIDPAYDINSEYENSFQSYGMWAVPPDLNIKVLCLFLNGDPAQGYWFGCIQDSYDAHMVPAIGAVNAATGNGNTSGYYWQPNPTQSGFLKTHQMLQQYIELINPQTGATEIPFRLPVSEPILPAQTTQPTSPSKVQLVPQVAQSRYLGIQGLAFDFLRGTTTASSIRENPSQVFGISTPGRLSPFANVALSQSLLQAMSDFVNDGGNANATVTSTVTQALNTNFRAGGHQFVLDDGTIDGQDQGIRIRSASGHTIQLDDTNGQIYIITANGNAWIELTPSGRIDIFADNDYSIRSRGNINFHADKNININANGSFNINSSGPLTINSNDKITLRSEDDTLIYSSGDLQLGSDGSLNFYAGGTGSLQTDSDLIINGKTTKINSGAGQKVTDPGVLPQTKQIDVKQISGRQVWWQEGNFNSIVTRAPAHEPWPGHEVNGIITYNISQGNVNGNLIMRPNTNGATSSGVRKTQKTPQINESAIAKQPLVGLICGLSASQTKALLAQIGQSESGGNYQATNSLGFSGKYQFGAQALETQQYLKPGSSKTGTNKQVISNSSNWTGKNGCNSQQDWLNNPTVQEQAMVIFCNSNCKQLQQYGVITANSTPEQIGGYMYAACLGGVGNTVKLWQYQNNQGGTDFQDANGTTSSSRYNIGSNAVQLASSSQQA
jgi:hypothetical protein